MAHRIRSRPNFYSEIARKHRLNENFFASIDTEEKAWLLGFTATDGGIVENTLRFNLGIKDIAALEIIKGALSSTAPILTVTRRTTGDICYCSFSSKTLVRDLAALGIGHRKAHVVKPWGGPVHLMPHYWRGAIDGDGTICWDRAGRKWIVGLSGNEFMVDGFREFVRNLTGITCARVRRHEHTWTALYNRFRVVRDVLQTLYGACEIALPRKLGLARKALLAKPRRRDWTAITADDLNGLKLQLGMWSLVAEHLGVSRQQLNAMKNRLTSRVSIPESERVET